MLSFKFSFELNEQKYVATATPFEKYYKVIYDISTPGKIFTIKGVLLKNDEMEWIDYYSSESTELSKAAGIAIQSIINGKSKYWACRIALRGDKREVKHSFAPSERCSARRNLSSHFSQNDMAYYLHYWLLLLT